MSARQRIDWAALLFRNSMEASEILGVFARVDQRRAAVGGTLASREITETDLRDIYLAALRIERLGITRTEPGNPGACRFCGCTADYACELEDGETCSWADAEQTVCSNPACLGAAELRRSRGRKRAAADKRGGR